MDAFAPSPSSHLIGSERALVSVLKLNEARELVPDGSGIGLYAARGLMRAMGGSIRVESEPGAGTRMRLTLAGS